LMRRVLMRRLGRLSWVIPVQMMRTRRLCRRDGSERESVFSVEAKVVDIKELSDRQREGMSVASVVVVKVTRSLLGEECQK
jgi:hypothetical protein